MNPFTATAAGFWLGAEVVIVVALIYFDGHIRRRRSVAALPYLLLGVLGFFFIFQADKLFANLGTPPFGQRLRWNLLCMFWVLLEWAMLFYISRLTAAAGRRFQGGHIRAMPRALHLFGIGAILAGTFYYHRTMYSLANVDEIRLWAYGYVRLAGFAYVFIEIAIAGALYRAWRLTREIGGLL